MTPGGINQVLPENRPAPCELLPWDSAHFGFPVARVCRDTLTPAGVFAIAAFCRQHRIRCLYFLARADHPPTLRLAAEQGFRLVDLRLTLACDLHTRPPGAAADAAFTIRPAAAADLPALRRLASHSFTHSRFFTDGRFPRSRGEALFDAWVTSCWDGRADLILVADTNAGPVGFTSLRRELRDDGPGIIDLFGVEAPWHGRGVGTRLLQEALDRFRRAGVDRVEVVTQGGNVPAQRLYQRHGFLTRAVGLWYHRWDDEVPPGGMAPHRASPPDRTG